MADDDLATVDAERALVRDLFNDPDTRTIIQSAIVKRHPKAIASMPDFQLRAAFAAEKVALDREREAFRKERDADRAMSEREKIHAGLRDDGFNTADIVAIEKLMQDELIGTPKAAGEVYRARQTVASPATVYSTRADIPGVGAGALDEFKGIIQDPGSWANHRAAEIMTDFRRGQGAKWIA